jgi:ABC-type lipoprotein release transport system permease subunit
VPSARRFLLVLLTSFIVTAAASMLDATTRMEPTPAAPGILLSRQLMEQAGIQVGDVVMLAVDSRGVHAAPFKVIGTYEPTPNPMKFSAKRLEARLHLPDLLALSEDPRDPLAAETVGALNVALVNPQEALKVASILEGRALGLSARPIAASTSDSEIFAVIDRFHWAIAIVTVVGSTAFLLALMVIRAEERREVVGILRLIGIPPRSILLEVLLEGLLIALGGAVFGLVIAAIGQGVINRFFQWRYDTTLTFVRVTIPIALQAAAFALPLGVVAGLAASWTLLRRDVVSLVRR